MVGIEETSTHNVNKVNLIRTLYLPAVLFHNHQYVLQSLVYIEEMNEQNIIEVD